MPLLEFRCLSCGKKFTDLVGVTADHAPRNCPHCGSNKKTKLVSKFAKFRAEDARIDEIADQLEGSADGESPNEMRQIVREMGKAMDEDLSDEMEAMFESDMEGKSDEED